MVRARPADALALSRVPAPLVRRVPQAFRIAIPPIGNQYLNLIKNSSLGAGIGYYDLTLVTKTTVGNGSPAVPAFTITLARVPRDLARDVGDRQHRQPSDWRWWSDDLPSRSGDHPAASWSSSWLRHNLFRGPVDSVVTILAGGISAWVLYKTIRFLFVTGRWDIIEVNLKLLMIGRFPEVHVLRLAVVAVALSAWAGLLAGIVSARQVRSGRVSPVRFRMSWPACRRSGAAVLDTGRRPAPVAVAHDDQRTVGHRRACRSSAAVAGRLVGSVHRPARLGRWGGAMLWLALSAVPIGLFFYVEEAVARRRVGRIPAQPVPRRSARSSSAIHSASCSPSAGVRSCRSSAG